MASYTGGSKASSRIQALEAERKKQREELERRKGSIAAASSHALNQATGSNFEARSETVEDLLKTKTVGLVTHEDFKARRKYLERCAAEEREKLEATKREREAEGRRQRLKKANHSTLSFGGGSDTSDDTEDDDVVSNRGPVTKRKLEGEDTTGKKEIIDAKQDENAPDGDMSGLEMRAAVAKRRKLRKNPDADTTFLPDREREIAEAAERERLKQSWKNEQEAIKNEVVRITYSYWDGSGHRRMVRCKKGTTVGRFLSMVQTQFKELRNTSADALMFIKEDLIIPHHYSFYDFIVSQARGVSFTHPFDM